jgi:hypothetical protein
VFRTGCGQIEAEFDGRFEFLRVKRKAENTIYARHSEGIILLGRDREGNDGHFAGDSYFADLVDGFNDALWARLEARGREEVVRSENHEIKFFAAGLVGEFVNASGSRRIDAGAVVADVEDHDFNSVANAAIRIADQKVERFHQFEKKCNRLVVWAECVRSCTSRSKGFANEGF